MYRVRVIASGVAGGPYYLTGYFDESAGTPQAAMTAWFGLVGGSPASVPTGATVSADPEVQIIDSVTGNAVGVANITPPTAVVGTNTSTRAARATQLLLRWKTGIYNGGRLVQGRTNLPFVFTSQIGQNGSPLATTVSGAQSAINVFLSVPNTSFVVWSKTTGQFGDVISGTCWTEFAVLRSRRD